MAKDEFGFDDAVIKILTKKENTIVGADADLLNSLDPIERKVFEAVRSQVSKMNKNGENLVFDEKNVDLLNEIDKIIAKELKAFAPPIKDYLRNFETIKEFNFDAQKSVNDLSQKQLEDLVNPIQKAMTQQTIDGLTGSGVNSQFIEPVKQGIFKNIVAGSTISDLESALRTWLVTSQSNNSLLRRYVTQVSRDALNQFDGQVNSAIAQEFDLDAFRYVGSLIDDSRAQCVRWAGRGVVLKSELEAEISWAFNNGSGMIPGTNKETFATFRGGYNCRHSAIPFKMTPSMKKKFLNEQEAQGQGETKAVDSQINEIEKQVKTAQKESVQAVKKKELKPGLLVTTQDNKLQDDFTSVLSDADDFVGIANNRNMFVTLRNTAQSTKAGTGKFLKDAGRSDLSLYNVWYMKGTSNGNCANDNEFLNVKIAKGQKIELKRYELKNSESWGREIQAKYNLTESRSGEIYDPKNGVIYAQIKKEKVKFWSVSAFSKLVDDNVAPTITHEAAHAIKNAQANSSRILTDILRKKGLTLSDAPTLYGESNLDEFWTESFTTYVYSNDFLKAEHPKVFEAIEEALDAYGIDKKTIKIAK
jgi:hypothetical protein